MHYKCHVNDVPKHKSMFRSAYMRFSISRLCRDFVTFAESVRGIGNWIGCRGGLFEFLFFNDFALAANLTWVNRAQDVKEGGVVGSIKLWIRASLINHAFVMFYTHHLTVNLSNSNTILTYRYIRNLFI